MLWCCHWKEFIIGQPWVTLTQLGEPPHKKCKAKGLFMFITYLWFIICNVCVIVYFWFCQCPFEERGFVKNGVLAMSHCRLWRKICLNIIDKICQMGICVFLVDCGCGYYVITSCWSWDQCPSCCAGWARQPRQMTRVWLGGEENMVSAGNYDGGSINTASPLL